MKNAVIPIGGVFRTFFALIAAVLLCTLAVFTASADVLVSEGFHASDYTLATATMLRDANPTGKNIGFSSSDLWAGGTAVPKSTAGSLTLDAAYDNTETNDTGKVIMLNDGKEAKGRGIYRKFSATLPTTGTIYYRFLMKLNANASDYTSALQSGGYWAGGLVQNTFSGGSDAMQSLTTDGIWMGYKKVGSAISLFGRVGSTDYVLPYTTSDSTLSTWSTFMFVARVRIGMGANGKDLVDMAAQPIASTAYNMAWDWNVKNVEANIVSGGTPVSYIAFGGQYQTGNKEVAIDQFKIATTLAEVCNNTIYTEPSASGVLILSSEVSTIADSSADLSASIVLNGVASATPSVAWGTTADALAHTNTLAAISAADTVTATLSGLDPMTTYYYQWTVAASGVDSATSPVDSFKTKGDVVFGDVTTGGRPSEGGVWASVGVVETGIGATTVTCWSGETAENMTAIGTWQNVQAGDTLVATNSAAAWGKTYLFKFVSTFEYNNNTYTTETPSGSVKPVALDFLKTTASGDWTDGANWSLGVPPNDVISAAISNVTTMASLYLEDTDAVVKSLAVKNGQATVDLRGASSMTIGSISFGDKNIMNCNSGVFATTGGVVTVNGNVAPEWSARTSWNRFEINGTEMTINGSLSTATGNDSGANNSVNVKLGSVLTITNGLTVSYTGTMIVDSSTVTNRANLAVGNNAKQGTLTIRNGACFRQHWASSTGVGGKGEGTLNVLNGSTFDASGAAFYLGCDGDNSTTAGTLLVSNSTFKAAGFVSPRHTQFKGLYKIDVSGENALFDVTGNATLGCVNMTASSYGTSGSTRMNVDGGSVAVGGTLNVGGGDYDRRNDYLTISGATASMRLGTLNCLTNAVVKFVVPENGFENADIVSATNKIHLAAGMPPITVDATECKNCAWVSLLAAEKGITNLTEENLASRVVLVEKDGHLTKGDRPYEFKLVTDSSGESPIVTALKFRVGSMGLAIIIR